MSRLKTRSQTRESMDTRTDTNKTKYKITSSGRRVIPTLPIINEQDDSDSEEGSLEMADDIYEETTSDNTLQDSKQSKSTSKLNGKKSNRNKRQNSHGKTSSPTTPADEMDNIEENEEKVQEADTNEGASALMSLFSSGASSILGDIKEEDDEEPEEDKTKKRKSKPKKAAKKKKTKTTKTQAEKRKNIQSISTKQKGRPAKKRKETDDGEDSDEMKKQNGRKNGYRRPIATFNREYLDKLFLQRKTVDPPPLSLKLLDNSFLKALQHKRSQVGDKTGDNIFEIPALIDDVVPVSPIHQPVEMKPQQIPSSYKRCATHVKIAYFIYNKTTQRSDTSDPTLEARLLKERTLNKSKPSNIPNIAQKNRPLHSPHQNSRAFTPLGASPSVSPHLQPNINRQPIPLMLGQSGLRGAFPNYHPQTRSSIQPLTAQQIQLQPHPTLHASRFPISGAPHMQPAPNIMPFNYSYLIPNPSIMNQTRRQPTMTDTSSQKPLPAGGQRPPMMQQVPPPKQTVQKQEQPQHPPIVPNEDPKSNTKTACK